jgi:hypothetical protein
MADASVTVELMTDAEYVKGRLFVADVIVITAPVADAM